MRSQFEVAEPGRARQQPIRSEMAAKATMSELTAALPEMLKDGCFTEEILTLLLELVHMEWEEQRVPMD